MLRSKILAVNFHACYANIHTLNTQVSEILFSKFSNAPIYKKNHTLHLAV